MKSETPQPAAAQPLLQQAAKEWLERYPYYDTTGAGESYIAFSRAWPIIAGIASQSEVQPPAAATQETAESMKEAIDDLAWEILHDMAEGDGEHTERLDHGLIVAKITSFMKHVQPAAAAPPIDLLAEFDVSVQGMHLLNSPRPNYDNYDKAEWHTRGIMQGLKIARTILEEILLARLRALQGTEK